MRQAKSLKARQFGLCCPVEQPIATGATRSSCIELGHGKTHILLQQKCVTELEIPNVLGPNASNIMPEAMTFFFKNRKRIVGESPTCLSLR